MSAIDIFNLISNIIISTSCFIISFLIIRFVIIRRSDGIPFRIIFILLASLFFFGGGASYAMIIYHDEIVDVIARALTAASALAVVIAIVFSIDRAFKLKTPKQYDEIDREKQKLLNSMRQQIKRLESKIDYGRSTQRS